MGTGVTITVIALLVLVTARGLAAIVFAKAVQEPELLDHLDEGEG